MAGKKMFPPLRLLILLGKPYDQIKIRIGFPRSCELSGWNRRVIALEISVTCTARLRALSLQTVPPGSSFTQHSEAASPQKSPHSCSEWHLQGDSRGASV
jgi:hypothetical protein